MRLNDFVFFPLSNCLAVLDEMIVNYAVVFKIQTIIAYCNSLVGSNTQHVLSKIMCDGAIIELTLIELETTVVGFFPL